MEKSNKDKKRKFTHNRNTTWSSLYGEKKLKDMDDTHVINTTHHLQARVNNYKLDLEKYNEKPSEISENYLENNSFLLNTFLQELDYRGISRDVVDEAPYPFRSPEGDLLVWDYKTKSPKSYPNTLRFIKEE